MSTQAKKPSKKSVPTHRIFQQAINEGIRGTLAMTLAECLFWSQQSTHQLEGRIALYKTGAELSAKLGIRPRTANNHLKKLAGMGYWSISYKALPSHPSPVSWLIISDKALALIQASQSGQSDAPKGTIAGCGDQPLQSPKHDLQASKNATTFIQTSAETMTDENSFVHSDAKHKNEEHAFTKLGQKVPSYIEADPDLILLFANIASLLNERKLSEWSASSKYTWEHIGRLRIKLMGLDFFTTESQTEIIAKIISQWDELRLLMEPPYRDHPTNFHRPSPMAFAAQLELLVAAVSPENLSLTDGIVNNLAGNFG